MPEIFSQTCFVLVEPSHPGNVGASARALKTMGFSRLVLVAPRVAQPHLTPEAVAMASGASDVLAGVQIVETLDEALAGSCWSVALSARRREYAPPLMSARIAAVEARECVQQGQIAIVFGNERVGLSNRDVERCRALCAVPANPHYSSLNLSQAVQILAYELRNAFTESTWPARGRAGVTDPAHADDIESMFAHLERALIALDFLDPANPKRLMSRLRQMLARSGLEKEEVNILRGIAKHALRKAGEVEN